MALEDKLRWQCRRGMHELDVLLGRWLERYYAAACNDRKAAFEALLALPDNELSGYLLHGKRITDPVAADVIQQMQDTYSA